jgi:DNA-binding CsgD family transcriptional regulator
MTALAAELSEFALGLAVREPTGGEPASGRDIVGRDSELEQVRGLVDPVPAASQVLLVLGEAGTGKTAILADAAARARQAGTRVLSFAAPEPETETERPFAALQMLLRPVLSRATALAEPQARILVDVLGPAQTKCPPADGLLTGIAVLTLLAEVARAAPVLVVLDDAQWADRSSLDALAFAASRLDAERVVLLIGMRATSPPPAFDRGFPELALEALRPADASRLLGAQPHPPHGRARAQVLAQAAGNPLALIELAAALAADQAAGGRRGTGPLPPAQRVATGIARQARQLPDATRAALLVAAVAGPTDLATAAGASPGLDPRALVAAEQLGLIKVDSRAGVRFTHPGIRSAIYHAAPFARRAAAHRDLAAALRSRPDRRAWHLAAAAPHPDEHVAALLEETAGVALHQDGPAAAALALERAAELSPDRGPRARRLVRAAELAAPTRQAEWVKDLADGALAIAADPRVRLRARRAAGWALAWSDQHGAALGALLPVAREAAESNPAVAWDALANASAAAYRAGTPASVRAVRDTLGFLEHTRETAPESSPWPAVAEAQRLCIRAATGPFRESGLITPLLDHFSSPGYVELDSSSLAWAGFAALLVDRQELAIKLLQAVRQGPRPHQAQQAAGEVLLALGWAQVDTGHWDDALTVAAEAGALALDAGTDGTSAALITATVLALRGDFAAARVQADRVLDGERQESESLAVRARHLLGVAALAEGSPQVAYDQLRRTVEQDGAQAHFHRSYLAIADFAAAAAGSGRRAEGRATVERVLARLDGAPSPRLGQLLGRARGLLADPDRAEADFAAALADPAGPQWPFEHAQLELDYGEWLRRQRRIEEAKQLLTPAHDTFSRLGVRHLTQRAGAELRACGVATAGAVGAPEVLAGLTPQQREILYLAGSGLSNREIGRRLFLSPRTVGTYLYRCYPKLGVVGRHQLRDLIPQL